MKKKKKMMMIMTMTTSGYERNAQRRKVEISYREHCSKKEKYIKSMNRCMEKQGSGAPTSGTASFRGRGFFIHTPGGGEGGVAWRHGERGSTAFLGEGGGGVSGFENGSAYFVVFPDVSGCDKLF